MGELSSLCCELLPQLHKPLLKTVTSWFMSRAPGLSWVCRCQIICSNPQTLASNLYCNSCNTPRYLCYLCASLNLLFFLPCVYPVVTSILHLHVHQMENCAFPSLLILIFWLSFRIRCLHSSTRRQKGHV